MISDQFDYIEFSAVFFKGVYTVFYQFVAVDHDKERIDGAVTIQTNIKAASIPECASEIQRVVNLGFFFLPITGTGYVYDPGFKVLGNVNWNDALMEHRGEEGQEKERVLH